MSNDPIAAKVVSTHEATQELFAEAWIVRWGDNLFSTYTPESRGQNRHTKGSAERYAKREAKAGRRALVVRLPSEAEAALAPLYEARDRAAVELAKFVAKYPDCEAMGVAPGSDLLDAFIAAQQALDAAIAATKGVVQ